MSIGNQNPHRLLDIAHQLEAQIGTLPQIRTNEGTDISLAHRRHRAACDAMAADMRTRRDARATISENAQGWRISMLGIRASSTCGFKAACQNWITQVRRKVADSAARTSRDRPS